MKNSAIKYSANKTFLSTKIIVRIRQNLVRISIFSNFICARQKIKFKNNQATFYQPLYLDMNFVLLTYKYMQSIFKQYQKKHQCKTIGSGLSFKDLPFINNMVEIRSYQNHYHQ